MWFFIPDRPDRARFLNEKERAIARARTRKAGNQGQDSGLKAKEVLQGFLDPKAWITALMYFSAKYAFHRLRHSVDLV